METKSKPFRPYITKEQILAYNPANPETFTPSREVNAILEALHTLGPGCGSKIVRYLRLDSPSLRYILKVTTGMTLVDLRKMLTIHMKAKLQAEHPKWKMPEIAKALGYDHRSSIWWLENADKQNKKRREFRRELSLKYGLR